MTSLVSEEIWHVNDCQQENMPIGLKRKLHWLPACLLNIILM
jgi:hypothetical protein